MSLLVPSFSVSTSCLIPAGLYLCRFGLTHRGPTHSNVTVHRSKHRREDQTQSHFSSPFTREQPGHCIASANTGELREPSADAALTVPRESYIRSAKRKGFSDNTPSRGVSRSPCPASPEHMSLVFHDSPSHPLRHLLSIYRSISMYDSLNHSVRLLLSRCRPPSTYDSPNTPYGTS